MTTAQWRTVTLVLAVVFILVMAFLVVVILSRTGDEGGLGSGATPSAIASGSPSPGPSGSTSPSPSASGSAVASPSAGPSPSGKATVPPARATIRGLGVDDPDSPQATPRVIVFISNGGGDVTVKLQNAVGGKVKFCLYPGTLAKPVGDPACLKTAGSTLTGHSKGKKPFTWTVTLVGAKGGNTPSVDLRIDWPATDPRLEITDFRLQGTGAEPYNGVVVDLAARPTAGSLTFAASWTDTAGDEHAFRATITDRETGATLDAAEGDGSTVALGANLAARQRTSVRLLNPEPSVATEVLAEMTLTWP